MFGRNSIRRVSNNFRDNDFRESTWLSWDYLAFTVRHRGSFKNNLFQIYQLWIYWLVVFLETRNTKYKSTVYFHILHGVQRRLKPLVSKRLCSLLARVYFLDFLMEKNFNFLLVRKKLLSLNFRIVVDFIFVETFHPHETYLKLFGKYIFYYFYSATAQKYVESAF